MPIRPKDIQLSSPAMGLVSAALRHVRDAERLLQAGEAASPDQAFHLAGFGPECARKAALSARWFDQALGHDFGDIGERVLELAAALDPVAHRYAVADYPSRFPALAKWNVSCRYHRTGEHAAEAAALVAEARKCVDEIVLALWMDGRWPDREELR
jgi:hypothetical protein